MDEYEYRARWTTGQKIACLILYAAAMGVVWFMLKAVVPPSVEAAQGAIGIGPLGVLMLLGWLALAFFGYRPLVKGWLAKRRS